MIKQISHRGKGKSTSTFNTVKKSDESDNKIKFRDCGIRGRKTPKKVGDQK